MKQITSLLIIGGFLFSFSLLAQKEKNQKDFIHPTTIGTGTFLGISPPLRDLPALTEEEYQQMIEEASMKELNEELKERYYPFASTAKPKGTDPAWQKDMGRTPNTRGLLMNVSGQSSPYRPSDCNGAAGPSHYMQTVNTTYAIYNKSGVKVAGPTNMNLLFGNVPGANRNDGDPIVLYDEQADRWLAAEFSLDGSYGSTTDRMLIAVSTTNDPTGTWYQYSFDVDDMPDYEKFGIWRDGYYMGTNTSSAGKDDIYVFERSKMLLGQTAQFIGFDNPHRPSSGFHCVPPVDNDGPFAPDGTPGIFITINDDAWNNGSDQLWIFELDVDWTTPSNSTFTRTQTIDVAAFDSNFGLGMTNIAQKGTAQKVDAIPQVLMQRPQFRAFCDYQTIVCCHTVDVDQTDHAGIRWYELRRTNGDWAVRQYGTYAPDAHSRWMGSIALNGNNELALGYNISSSTLYPGIRYCGQSVAAYNAASGLSNLDIAEAVIQNGTQSQSGGNGADRWGDYSNICIDPSDDHTFWYTTEYYSGGKVTKIAKFSFSNQSAPTPCFVADKFYPSGSSDWVNFTDKSSGVPTSWSWSISPATYSFVGGTSSTSQNPTVSFTQPGAYTVSLTTTNAAGNNTQTRTAYIHVGQRGLWKGSTSADWNTNTNWENHEVPPASIDVSIIPTATNWPVKTGNLTIGTDCNSLNMADQTQITVTGNLTIQSGKTFTVASSGNVLIKIGGTWTNNGTFSQGASTVEFYGTGNSVINTQGSGPVYLINDDFSNWTGNWNGDLDGTSSTPEKFTQASSNNAGDIQPEARFTYINSNPATRRMYYDAVNTTGLSSLTLTFRHKVDDYSGSGYTIKVQYSTDAATWNDAWSVSPTGDIGPQQENVPLTSSQGVGASTYYISFTVTGNLYNLDNWYIDDVQLYYGASGSKSFNNLTISKASALVSTNGDVDVQNAFIVKPDAWFTNSAGNTLSVAGSFVLEADAFGTASFIDNGTLTITGTSNIQYFCSSGEWHYIASCFDPGSNHFSDFFAGNNPLDFYRWDESHTEQGSTGWWINILHGSEWTTGTFVAAEGYAITDNTKGTVYSFSGNPYNTTKTLAMTKTSGSVAEGWNLVGNPFPSNIAANTNADGSNNFLSANTSVLDNSYTAIYLWDDNAGDYVTFSNSSPATFISPGQGFMVKTAADGNNISFTSALRKHGVSAFFKAGDETQRFHITVIDPQNKTNKAEIVFMDNMTLGLDPSYDAGKYQGNPQLALYSLMVDNNSAELSIQALPLLDEPVAVPVGLHAGMAGNYSFTVEMTNFEDNIPVTLVDHYTAKQVDLRENPVYPFVVEEAGTFNDRFVIFFKSSVGIEDEVDTDQQSFDIYSRGKRITVVPLRKTDSYCVHIFNIVGQEILVRNVSGNDPVTIDMNNSTGYYVVNVQSDKDVITKKVLVK